MNRNLATSLLLVVPVTFVILGAVVFAALALYMIAIDDDDQVLTGIMVSAILTAICGAVVIGAGVVRRKGRMQELMVLSAVLAPAALLSWLVAMWTSIAKPGSDDMRLIILALALTVASGGLAYTGLMTLQPTRSLPLRAMRGILIAGAWLFGFLLTLLATVVWLEPDLFWMQANLTFMLYGFLQLLGVALLIGSLVVPLVIRNHARRRARPRESISSTMRMSMNCPRCAIDLEVRQGPARCDACGFTMLIEVEEPRCECGYLLFALTTPTCPECGRSIDLQQSQVATADERSSTHVIVDR